MKLEEDKHRIHWKHWLMHSGNFILTTLFCVAVDVYFAEQLHLLRAAQPMKVRWMGPVLAVDTNFTLLGTNALPSGNIQVGALENGMLVWREAK